MNGNPLLILAAPVAAILFVAGSWLHRRYPRTALLLGIGFSLPCVLAVLYYAHLFDRWAAYYEFRSWRYTELTFSGIGLLGGTLHDWHRPQTWRERVFFPLLTAGVLFIPFIKPLLYPLDVSSLKDRCEGAVCLQSSLATCGPASAATILRTFGEHTTEKDLAIDSFTYGGGTEVWYLARSLRNRGYSAKFAITDDSDLPHPSIAGVKLAGGAGHFIALLNSNTEKVTFVDPMYGEASLSTSELRRRYRFTGLYLKIAPKLQRTH